MVKVNVQKLQTIIRDKPKNLLKTPLNIILIGKVMESKMLFSYFVSINLAS